VARTPRPGSPGYLSRAPPSDSPTQVTAFAYPCAAGTKTLVSAAAVDSPPPPLFRRRDAARELRQEVSFALVSRVVELEHCSALEISPEFPSRAASLSARAAASPSQPPSLLATPTRVLHVGIFRAPNRAPEP
jgi:hypothetical protein